jgi:hypothetical protein
MRIAPHDAARHAGSFEQKGGRVPFSRWLFPPGSIVVSPQAIAVLEESGETLFNFVNRHVCGDWGDAPQERRAANMFALISGDRLFSAYRTAVGRELWVITDQERATTGVLLPHEYHSHRQRRRR